MNKGHTMTKCGLKFQLEIRPSAHIDHLFGTLVKKVVITCPLDAVMSSGILKAKQKLGRTFNSDKLGGIAFTKISKLTMCSA